MADDPPNAALFEEMLSAFVEKHQLRFKWARQELLRMEAGEGGTNAPVCVAFPKPFWDKWETCSTTLKHVAADGIAETVATRYNPLLHPPYALVITADPRSLDE